VIHYPLGTSATREPLPPLPRAGLPKCPGAALQAPLDSLHGIGSTRAARLHCLGLDTVEDLLLYLPFRHETPARLSRVSELKEGAVCTIQVRVGPCSIRHGRRRGLRILEALVADDSGSIVAVWYNQEYLREAFAGRPEVLVRGRMSFRNRTPRFIVQRHEIIGHKESGPGGILALTPVYPATADVSLRLIQAAVRSALPVARDFVDPLPARLLAARSYPGKAEAIACAHFPATESSAVRARKRLAFEELLLLQVALLERRRAQKVHPAVGLGSPGPLCHAFLKELPYRPTGAQERVMAEIDSDLRAHTPMLRLLQGDVGSGKTLVAVYALLRALDAGGQGVLMAPTEILADQHAERLREALESVGVEILTLKGSLPVGHKRRVKRILGRGHPALVVGTHALIQEDVSIPNLRVVVIDEQHRFGVGQRDALLMTAENESRPHVLHMTATPIPRTLSLTVYGDLDVSVIDEMPPGRRPVKTKCVRPEQEGRAWRLLRRRLDEGGQAYVVCPLIEESPALQSAAATSTYEALSAGELSGYAVRLLHGRMPPAEKRDAMQAFAQGRVQVLVSTTVIEVGVDVANASVMVILGAGRFGLSQLHQLRGRVGRGQDESMCLLMVGANDLESGDRLALFARNPDGFQLAELDLAARGEGQLFGERQTGLGDLKIARLRTDRELLEDARREALHMFEADPGLLRPDHALLAWCAAQRFAGVVERLERA